LGCRSSAGEYQPINTISNPTITNLPQITKTTQPSKLQTQVPSPSTHQVTQTNQEKLIPSHEESHLISLCSPIEGIRLNQLAEIVSNPFSPPQPGSDHPHQGIDLSITDPTSGYAIEGNTVNAIITGRVVSIINDRFPYGNAVIIETPLVGNFGSWFRSNLLPTPVPTQQIHTVLTCPKIKSLQLQEEPSASNRISISLYHLYAHLLEPVEFSVDEEILCGTKLGQVGMSGNAINPHLHLELRIGPSGENFSSLAHYDTNASETEMSNYCLWRVSGRFQAISPMDVFSLSE
jgi:murein DD-endopeptidase MepM/ murein hydrolase activator NlpD